MRESKIDLKTFIDDVAGLERSISNDSFDPIVKYYYYYYFNIIIVVLLMIEIHSEYGSVRSVPLFSASNS
jgi:hypothetical protein